MIPGLDGDIHRDTQWALLAALAGGLLAGYAAANGWPAIFLALVSMACYSSLLIVPDAETVATEWIVRQDEYPEADRDA